METILGPSHPTGCPSRGGGDCEPKLHEGDPLQLNNWALTNNSQEYVATAVKVYVCQHCQKPYFYQVDTV